MDLSIAVDRMPKNGETLNGYGFLMNAGGKGGNQAVASARAQSPTYMIASIGNDTFGLTLKEGLRRANVNVHYVKESPVSTGIAMIVRCDHDNRIILENGANHTIAASFIEEAIEHVGKANDIFLTQLENNLSAIASGLYHAKRKGLYTIFNPAPAVALPKEMYRHVDLFIVNQSECELLSGVYPTDEVTQEKAFSFFSQHDCDVIITLGKQGSVACIQQERYVMDAYAVDCVDTTGAGDTYVGVLCAMLAQQKPMLEALHYANAASALSVTKVGAQGAIPSLKEIEKFMKEQNV